MIPDKKIIAVMPAYHAMKTLRETVEAIPDGWVDETILVDDASSDHTADIARELGITTIVHQKNTGYGGNQKTCYREALARGADIAVMIHPDFQYNPRYVPDMIRPIAEGGADAVFGSRMLVPGGALRGGMPYWKFVANKALTLFENFVLGLRLSEYHSGFRAYSREVLSSLPLEKNADGFVFDSEIIVQLAFAGFRIKEIPIETRYFKDASMIGFWKSVGYGLGIVRLMMAAVAARAGLTKDSRFSGLRYRCPVCLGRNLILWLAASAETDNTAVRNYRITEDAIGIHFDIFRCRSCGSAIQPLPNDASTDSLYAEQPCDRRYLAEEVGRRRAFRRVLRRLESFLRPSRLIDLGCGPGLFLSEAKNRGWDVSGVEASTASAAYARSHFGILVLEGRLPDVLSEVPDASIDVVTAFDLLEHVSDPNEIFREVRRVLKSGGLFLFTTPRFGSLVQRILGRRWYAILPTHLVYFSNFGVSRTAARHGFTIVFRRSFRRYFSLSYLWIRLSWMFKRIVAVTGGDVDKKISGFAIPVQLFDEHEVYLCKSAAD